MNFMRARYANKWLMALLSGGRLPLLGAQYNESEWTIGPGMSHYWLMPRRAAVGLAVVLLLPAASPAQVYRWDDQEGTRHYTNSPEAVPEPYRATLDASASAASSPVDAVALAPPTLVPPTATTRIPYTAGNPILVQATIGGTGPLTLILDTGADRTMIAPQALSRLGISTANATRAEIRGVTGADQADVVQVGSLEVGKLADFVARSSCDVRVPIARGDFARGFGQALDGLRDARRHPAAEQNRQQDSDGADDEREDADMALQLDQAAARTAHQQHAQERSIRALERNGVEALAIGGVGVGDVKMQMGFGAWIGAFYGLGAADKPGAIPTNGC